VLLLRCHELLLDARDVSAGFFPILLRVLELLAQKVHAHAAVKMPVVGKPLGADPGGSDLQEELIALDHYLGVELFHQSEGGDAKLVTAIEWSLPQLPLAAWFLVSQSSPFSRAAATFLTHASDADFLTRSATAGSDDA